MANLLMESQLPRTPLIYLKQPCLQFVSCLQWLPYLYLQATFPTVSGLSLVKSKTRRIRSLFLHSVLNQDMGWFDAAEEGSLNNRLAADTQIVKDGISEKFGQFVSLFAQFFAGFLVAFLKGNIVVL